MARAEAGLGAEGRAPGPRRACGRLSPLCRRAGSAPHWPPGSSRCFICPGLLGGAVSQTRRKHGEFILRRSDIIPLRSRIRSEHLAHGCGCRPAPAALQLAGRGGASKKGEQALTFPVFSQETKCYKNSQQDWLELPFLLHRKIASSRVLNKLPITQTEKVFLHQRVPISKMQSGCWWEESMYG